MITLTDSVQNILINSGDSVSLVACAIGPRYQWQSTQYIPCSGCAIIKVAPIQSPSLYTCLVTDNVCRQLCRYTISVILLTDGMAIPNAFSPNGDGLNDVFRIIHNNNVRLNYFKILNRYGEEVFSTTDISKGWDGTYKGQAPLNGTYVYIISASDISGRSIFRQGTLLLLK